MAKKNLFTQVELTKLKSNVFDLSHDVKLSCKMGQLVPIMVTECVPGDKFSISCESLLRFAPLVAPVMHRMDVFFHYFFVPNRLLWSNWENYITQTKVAGAVPACPFIQVNGTTAAMSNAPLLNYMGIPNFGAAGVTQFINPLALAAYQKIYSEYYRDQNLIADNPAWYTLGDGDNSANSTNLVALRRRAWEHDYFTSALPFAQKNDPVTIPIGTFQDVPVHFNEDEVPANTGLSAVGTTNPVPLGTETPDTTMTGSGLFADTSELNNTTTAANISDLRRAFKLQEWLERAARGGSRYIEFIRSMFGVHSSDKRLQRPEYITGVKSPVVISEVLNTTGTVDAPQGAMAGHGVSVTSGNYGKYFCEEHGYIIGIMSVMPKTAYQQGIPKHFLKTDSAFDYYFEQFAHIGEQAILNKEIYAFTANGNDTFGYIPRYAEYKFENNRVAGDFRDTLDIWHLGRQFATPPALNQTFIECTPDTRIFAVEDGTDYLWAHVYNKVKAVRKMPYFGNPHF